MISASFPRPVCVLGLGLIGGSLLKDLRDVGADAYGWNRSTIPPAEACGCDISPDLEDTLARAERDAALLVLATPWPAIPGLLDEIALRAPSCGITDVVSVKGAVQAAISDRGLEDRYVGGHPMAGTTESGWRAARTGLFRGAAWVVTFDHADTAQSKGDHAWPKLWRDVVQLASLVGAEPIPARSARHDDAVARISHLPHVFAEVLSVVGDAGGALSLSLAAGSFRDGTRVAATAPALVRAMCETNAASLVGALDEAISLLREARGHLAAEVPSLAALSDTGHASRVRYEARAGRAGVGGSVANAGGAPGPEVSGGAGAQAGSVPGGSDAADLAATPAPSPRPIFRVTPGGEGWVNQLVQAEALGAHITVL